MTINESKVSIFLMYAVLINVLEVTFLELSINGEVYYEAWFRSEERRQLPRRQFTSTLQICIK